MRLDERAEYKKLVEKIQNGYHQNGGSDYSMSKVAKLHSNTVNGVNHNSNIITR